MKRHQVMDLFHANKIEPTGEWHDVEKEMPNRKNCKVLVKLNDDSTTFAYFYSDKAQWIENYGKKPAYFWHYKTHEQIYNLKSWKYLKENE